MSNLDQDLKDYCAQEEAANRYYITGDSRRSPLIRYNNDKIGLERIAMLCATLIIVAIIVTL